MIYPKSVETKASILETANTLMDPFGFPIFANLEMTIVLKPNLAAS